MYKSLLGTDFIQYISAKALSSKAVNHPYLRAIREGNFPNVDLAFKDFAHQYGIYSSHFTHYVSAVIDKLSDTRHKQILINNLAEEKGDAHDVELPPDVMASVIGQPHTLLFRRFQKALGVDTIYRNTMPESEAALLWREQFLKLCQQDQFVGIGAIGIGTELIVSQIYHHILEGLKLHSDLTMTQRVFFDLHSECDDEHAEQILFIAKDLAVNDVACKQIEYGVNTAINLRITFWDKMLERAQRLSSSTSPIVEKLSTIGY